MNRVIELGHIDDAPLAQNVNANFVSAGANVEHRLEVRSRLVALYGVELKSGIAPRLCRQVAQIIKTCYREMSANRNWPHTKKLIKLDAVNDLSKPTYLKLPEEVKELILFNYDKTKMDDQRIDISEVTYKEPEVFLRYCLRRNLSDENIVETLDFSGTKFFIHNNRAPQYWTSFDDTYIVCDSYDKTVDDTLKQSKTQALVYGSSSWSPVDSFIPDMPSEAFPALLEEAKSTAFFVLKQMVNQKAEQKVKRQQTWLSRKAWRAAGGVQYANFGRKGRR